MVHSYEENFVAGKCSKCGCDCHHSMKICPICGCEACEGSNDTDHLHDKKEIFSPIGFVLKTSLNPYVPKFEGDE